MNKSHLLAAMCCATVTACASASPAKQSLAPASQIGEFLDDYGERYRITATEWTQLPRARYHILKWNVAGQYLIARNDSANASDAGLWTRIDWVDLPGMPPYRWGFCYSAYRAPSAAVAETVSVARRETPRTGCNGFPFSRMKQAP
jgi:hypothetical protein